MYLIAHTKFSFCVGIQSSKFLHAVLQSGDEKGDAVSSVVKPQTVY